MIALEYSNFVWLALLTVPISWMVPRSFAFDAVALWSAIVVLLLSPPTLIWLGLIAVCVSSLLHDSPDRGRGFMTGLICFFLIGGLIAARSLPTFAWLGGAFFTLRALHVTLDWWMGTLPSPTLRESLRYFFFLPVIPAGPINRLPHFSTQLRRRRWDLPTFATGFERFLLGAIFFFVISGYGMDRVISLAGGPLGVLPPFLEIWALSALSWIDLFFAFAGSTHIALGITLMIGLALEENFNKPWRARNLLDFWTRWHMTLTRWVQDYVYQPIVGLTRKPVIGLLLAMLVIGLWHAFSLYYVLWAFWQSLGIILARLIKGRGPSGRLAFAIGPLGVLAWLSAARPVLDLIGVSQ